jgi:phosphoserine phosphatase RsbU/P
VLHRETQGREARPLPLSLRERDVLDAVSDSMLIMDDAGIIVYANAAALYAYGYSSDQLLGLSIRSLRARDASENLDQQFRIALDGGITFETVHQRRDGTVFPVEVSSSPHCLDGRDGVISVVRDITARKESEELRARLLEQLSEANARLDGALTLLSSAVGASDLRDLLENTVAALAQVMGADGALFIIKDGDAMRVSAEAGSTAFAPVGTTLKCGEGFCGRVAEAGAPLYVADITSTSANIAEQAGVHSMFGVPVYVDDTLFGVLECAWRDERPVDEAESAMIKLAADRIALAIGSARMLDASRRGERLNAVLNEINARLNASFEPDPALDGVLELACSAIECDSALLGRAVGGDWRVEHAHGIEVPESDLLFDQVILGAATAEEPLVFSSAASPHGAWLTSRLGLVEAVVAPVPARRGVGGALLFGWKADTRNLDPQSTEFIRRLAQSLALALSNAERFEAEHHIAETLQEALLLMPPAIRGLDFSHLYRSATLTTRVGGDFFDVFEMADGRVGALVGDVSGKGLEAAVLTSIIKDTIRAYAHDTPSPAVAIARANTALGEAAKLPDFASVFFAVIDGANESITYCNAGHPPAAVIGSDRSVRLLEGGSPIIGAFPDLTYEDRTVPLRADETVLLYTDGVTEARDESGAFFAEEGLVNSLVTASLAGSEDMPGSVFAAVMEFTRGRLTDDIALLAFRHTGGTAR